MGRKKLFSLIEIAVAMAVAAIGVAAIMALLPIAAVCGTYGFRTDLLILALLHSMTALIPVFTTTLAILATTAILILY